MRRFKIVNTGTREGADISIKHYFNEIVLKPGESAEYVSHHPSRSDDTWTCADFAIRESNDDYQHEAAAELPAALPSSGKLMAACAVAVFVCFVFVGLMLWVLY